MIYAIKLRVFYLNLKLNQINYSHIIKININEPINTFLGRRWAG